mmetsp:Transcript_25336/g.47111  ORF Transcript_25336/g.47111 Transcript_25336/m.47111 type:complete len:317 (-) Transcript_25336:45-995(-)
MSITSPSTPSKLLSHSTPVGRSFGNDPPAVLPSSSAAAVALAVIIRLASTLNLYLASSSSRCVIPYTTVTWGDGMASGRPKSSVAEERARSRSDPICSRWSHTVRPAKENRRGSRSDGSSAVVGSAALDMLTSPSTAPSTTSQSVSVTDDDDDSSASEERTEETTEPSKGGRAASIEGFIAAKDFAKVSGRTGPPQSSPPSRRTAPAAVAHRSSAAWSSMFATMIPSALSGAEREPGGEGRKASAVRGRRAIDTNKRTQTTARLMAIVAENAAAVEMAIRAREKLSLAMATPFERPKGTTQRVGFTAFPTWRDRER